MEAPWLRQLLFGQDHVPKPSSDPGQLAGPNENALCTVAQEENPVQTKKPRLMDGWAVPKHDSCQAASDGSWPPFKQTLIYQSNQLVPGQPQLPFNPLQNQAGFAGSGSSDAMMAPPTPPWPVNGLGVEQQHASGAAAPFSVRKRSSSSASRPFS